MTRQRFTIFLVLLLFAVVCLHAAEETGPIARVQSSVDHSVITVGDVILYTLEMQWAEGWQADDVQLGANLNQFEIQDYVTGETEKMKRGWSRMVTTYRISVYETGDFTIPGLPIAFKDADGNALVLNSEALDIHVVSSDPDMTGSIRDIRPPQEIKVDWRPFILGISLAVLLVASLVFALLWYRKYKAKKLREKLLAPPPPADKTAFERLAKLEALDLINEGQIKQYYTELSEILREYLEGRYFLSALESTTDEILFESSPLPIATEQRNSMQELLETSDLVKFARHQPPDHLHQRMMDLTCDFVEKTKNLGAGLAQLDKADPEENGASETESPEQDDHVEEEAKQ